MDRTPEEAQAIEERLAREVMGWTIETRIDRLLKAEQHGTAVYLAKGVIWRQAKDSRHWNEEWHPLTDANDALEVLSSQELSWWRVFKQHAMYGGGHGCTVRPARGGDDIERVATTAPEAICLAVIAWLETR